MDMSSRKQIQSVRRKAHVSLVRAEQTLAKIIYRPLFQKPIHPRKLVVEQIVEHGAQLVGQSCEIKRPIVVDLRFVRIEKGIHVVLIPHVSLKALRELIADDPTTLPAETSASEVDQDHFPSTQRDAEMVVVAQFVMHPHFVGFHQHDIVGVQIVVDQTTSGLENGQRHEDLKQDGQQSFFGEHLSVVDQPVVQGDVGRFGVDAHNGHRLLMDDQLGILLHPFQLQKRRRLPWLRIVPHHFRRIFRTTDGNIHQCGQTWTHHPRTFRGRRWVE